MTRKRRKFSAGLKARVALEALKGQRSVSDLAGEHQLHPNLVTQWKKQLADAAESVFGAGAGSIDKDEHEALLGKLYEQIGRMKVELEWLQKKLRSS